MNDMKLIMESWRSFLAETANKAFLDEFMPIYKKWHDVQSGYGEIHTGTWIDPEGEAHYPKEVQDVPDDEQPDYVKDDPKFYQANVDHPATRRATFSQTQAEVDVEKELLRLFQKYADQGFFKNDVLKYHDFSYQAAVQQPWTNGRLKFHQFSQNQYLTMEGQRGKDVMSCHGSTGGKVKGFYGMILQGHTIFASRGDLGSQTLRTAHDKVKEKYKSSGLPKRASPHKLHPTDKRLEQQYSFYNRRRKMQARRGRKVDPELSIDEYVGKVNSVVLDASDVTSDGSSGIEELLLANWTIEGWYFNRQSSTSNEPPRPESFWRKAYEIGLEKPVFSVNMQGEMEQVDLSQFFGDDEE